MPRIRGEGEPPVRWSLPVRQSFYKVPGLSVSVIEQGKIEWAKGYGESVTPTTRFQAASISKPLAAVTALRLVQSGLLTLDEVVNKKLKSWKVPDNQWGKPVTLR
jgi:CubicO group peptidase (beta-lactamase class C family)